MSDELRDNTECTLSYKDLIRESTFLGETPFDTILECITEQFDDYVNLADKTNYVDVFYYQWQQSYDVVYYDDREDHPVEKKEILQEFYDEFIETITALFEDRLAISINDTSVVVSSDESQHIISTLYEYFILRARRNFRNVFARSIVEYIGEGVPADSDEFFNKASERLKELEGIITDIHTNDFLEWSNGEDGEVLTLFQEELVLGNFLRKYSAKLYQNDEFFVEIITYITMYVGNQEDIALLWRD